MLFGSELPACFRFVEVSAIDACSDTSSHGEPWSRIEAEQMRQSPAPDGTLDLGELPEILGYLLRLSARASDQLVLPVLRENGFTRAEVTALLIVCYNPDRSLQALARAIGIEMPATQRLLNALHTKGHVTRRNAEHDRRLTLYRATESGHLEAERMKRLSNQQDRRLLEGLTTEEQQELFRLLRHISRPSST
ncbi:winged helix-turn-helix transcriptional regulator [Tianweitania sp. BSSL-BM11]|uniref:Winged helix-turn-helix transcriptional regulator n=1 Tax=Tianweitania aestuarii TaxID=2814886 RepID=A0ABS5RX36_9HYPH|nr:MarR family winged helix-turn-helix transcriptional regulator [Tianweitania aestuarii]MBS9721623.1 winged helix-turn-helix transcriptional regulator [Tianweitania aestuarii]